MKKLLLLFVLLFAVSCTTPTAEYIRADRETLETVGADWAQYFRSDNGLSPIQLQIKEDKLASWESRVEAVEKEVGLTDEN